MSRSLPETLQAASIASVQPVLEVRNLVKHFPFGKGYFAAAGAVRAVDSINLLVAPGEAFGLVGESGCGKSTAARTMLRLIEPDSGSIMVDGRDFAGMSGAELKSVRRDFQIVFQDPYSSLNPRRTIGQALTEPMKVHGLAGHEEAQKRAAELLDEVGLPTSALTRYPHEFSGGQRQRIGIARALALGPRLIIADEPVSALDVSIQAQILMTLKALQERRRLAFLFVSHDLGVVRWFCARVAIMYLGRIVEQGPVEAIFARPRHPYARMLRDASPVPDPKRRSALPRIVGEIPSAAAPPAGCHFHPRCPRATDRCRTDYPVWQGTLLDGFACHHPLEN